MATYEDPEKILPRPRPAWLITQGITPPRIEPPPTIPPPTPPKTSPVVIRPTQWVPRKGSLSKTTEEIPEKNLKRKATKEKTSKIVKKKKKGDKEKKNKEKKKDKGKEVEKKDKKSPKKTPKKVQKIYIPKTPDEDEPSLPSAITIPETPPIEGGRGEELEGQMSEFIQGIKLFRDLGLINRIPIGTLLSIKLDIAREHIIKHGVIYQLYTLSVLARWMKLIMFLLENGVWTDLELMALVNRENWGKFFEKLEKGEGIRRDNEIDVSIARLYEKAIANGAPFEGYYVGQEKEFHTLEDFENPGEESLTDDNPQPLESDEDGESGSKVPDDELKAIRDKLTSRTYKILPLSFQKKEVSEFLHWDRYPDTDQPRFYKVVKTNDKDENPIPLQIIEPQNPQGYTHFYTIPRQRLGDL